MSLYSVNYLLHVERHCELSLAASEAWREAIQKNHLGHAKNKRFDLNSLRPLRLPPILGELKEAFAPLRLIKFNF